MAEFFEMPQASPTMEFGTVLSWKKAEGDSLSPQDVLAEVETDKAAMVEDVDVEEAKAGLFADEDHELQMALLRSIHDQ